MWKPKSKISKISKSHSNFTKPFQIYFLNSFRPKVTSLQDYNFRPNPEWWVPSPHSTVWSKHPWNVLFHLNDIRRLKGKTNYVKCNTTATHTSLFFKEEKHEVHPHHTLRSLTQRKCNTVPCHLVTSREEKTSKSVRPSRVYKVKILLTNGHSHWFWWVELFIQ